MRRALVAVALACSACATATNYLDADGPRFLTSAGQVRSSEPGVRVVTFNVENGQRVPQATRALREHPALREADVIVLQEMDAAGVESVARALGMNAAYFPVSRTNDHDLGNAVLSPWPIDASWKVLLPHRTRLVKRGRAAVAARVLVEGQALIVYSVHLGSPLGLSGGKRKEQAKAVLSDTAGRSEPVIVAGDFNSKSVGEIFEGAGFAWPTKDVGRTIGPFSFDHIFGRGLRGEPGKAGVAREVDDASDHRPVWSVLFTGP